MVGRYRIERLLGQRSLAEVYLASMTAAHGFSKKVALKRIRPQYSANEAFARMLIDEARITALVSHPNVAQVFELVEEEGELILVMEYTDGAALSSVLRDLPPPGVLPAPAAVYIVAEVLQGLHAAHVQKLPSGEPARIVHRDVSPQNVLVMRSGHVKVIDFGIAKAKGRIEETVGGAIKGKLRYLSPEVISPRRFSSRAPGAPSVDGRADIFAAGVVLWEMLAGRRLFEKDRADLVMAAITDRPIPSLDEERICDAKLASIVRRALARMVDERYADAETFARDLRRWLWAHAPDFSPSSVGARVP
jgi:serine/threonine-protein kinase